MKYVFFTEDTWNEFLETLVDILSKKVDKASLVVNNEDTVSGGEAATISEMVTPTEAKLLQLYRTRKAGD